MPAIKDNRDFIEALAAKGELLRIAEEVDWDLEAGAIVRKTCEDGGPAVLMENIKDYPGHRFLGAPLASYRRLAICLGLEPDSSIPAIATEYQRRTSARPVPPVLVDRSQAPCKQNILMGKDADLCVLPAPMVHDGDGGRYLGTWHFVVTKDPDTGEVNWGMYRQMVFDSQLMTGQVLPISDAGKVFFGKYVPRGEPMPFATVIAPGPLEAIAASAPAAVPEPDFTGMLMQQPIELVKCETCDLEVPAHAEAVIEGVILPDVRLEEGPFGEYTGYRTAPRDKRVTFLIKCITFRNDPITTISCMGVPTDEGQLLRSFSLGLELEKLLRSQGLPITGVYMPAISAHHMMIVGVKPAYTGIATQIAQLAFGSKLGPWFHMLVVVDDTVDIYNLNEVLHTLCTRCHPRKGIHLWDGAGTQLYPFLYPEERVRASGYKVVFDCLFPNDWDERTVRPRLVSFRSAYPQEIQDRVLALWQKYGL
ncbi:MAG: phenylphosphate carboxylase subunit alpha [Moorellales bacterium]